MPKLQFNCIHSGFSLIEVLIALCILGFSLLALAGFATAAWKRTNDAYFMSSGVVSAANRTEAIYAGDNQHYHNVWQKGLAQTLPQGKGESSGKKDNFKIAVCWQLLFQRNKFCYKLNS